jgi:hypothetical protein
MSLIELIIVIFLTLGLIDKNKLSNILTFLKNDNLKQKRDVIGDNSVNEKWIWLEEE